MRYASLLLPLCTRLGSIVRKRDSKDRKGKKKKESPIKR